MNALHTTKRYPCKRLCLNELTKYIQAFIAILKLFSTKSIHIIMFIQPMNSNSAKKQI